MDTKPQSLCILGRQPALGLAELESLYGAGNVSAASAQAARVQLEPDEIDFSRLGGSTRLARILCELPTTDWKQLERELPALITELGATLPDGKIQLGLSAFGLKLTPSKLNAAGLTLKKILRSKLNRSVRITPNPELELNTAQVVHNHLTGPTGVELLLVATDEGKTIIARTHRVQDIASYTLRDRGRPRRDARVGMLPPKLAQILINLAAGPIMRDGRWHMANGTKTSETPPTTYHMPSTMMLDPFCGTGVALQEAVLMGYGVYGTDLEPRMVDYTRANLDWLIEHTEGLQPKILLEPGDATTYQWNPAPDFVAGETYLGRPFTTQPTAEILAQTVSEVNLILKKFLKNIHPQLSPGTRLCLAVPAWHVANGTKTSETPPTTYHMPSTIFKHLPLIDQISDLGYNRVSFEHVRNDSLLYYREDQIVARELLVITRK